MLRRNQNLSVVAGREKGSPTGSKTVVGAPSALATTTLRHVSAKNGSSYFPRILMAEIAFSRPSFFAMAWKIARCDFGRLRSALMYFP